MKILTAFESTYLGTDLHIKFQAFQRHMYLCQHSDVNISLYFSLTIFLAENTMIV